MPKQKSHSASKKRFKITKSGKVMRPHAHIAHKRTRKTAKQKRRLRGTTVAHPTSAKRIKSMLPYK